MYRTFRTFLRVLLAFVLGAFLLITVSLWNSRGFLPSHRRTVFLQASESSDGSWTVHQIDYDEDDSPAAPENGDFIIRVQEGSMGRTGSPWDRWRASSWLLLEAYSNNESYDFFTDDMNNVKPEFAASVRAYVERQIAPTSPALAIWPDTPFDYWMWSDSLLLVGQSRFNALGFSLTVVVILAIAYGIARLVLPPIQPDESDAEAMNKAG